MIVSLPPSVNTRGDQLCALHRRSFGTCDAIFEQALGRNIAEQFGAPCADRAQTLRHGIYRALRAAASDPDAASAEFKNVAAELELESEAIRLITLPFFDAAVAYVYFRRGACEEAVRRMQRAIALDDHLASSCELPLYRGHALQAAINLARVKRLSADLPGARSTLREVARDLWTESPAEELPVESVAALATAMKRELSALAMAASGLGQALLSICVDLGCEAARQWATALDHGRPDQTIADAARIVRTRCLCATSFAGSMALLSAPEDALTARRIAVAVLAEEAPLPLSFELQSRLAALCAPS